MALQGNTLFMLIQYIAILQWFGATIRYTGRGERRSNLKCEVFSLKTVKQMLPSLRKINYLCLQNGEEETKIAPALLK